MANSRIWYYPSVASGFGGSPTVEVIDFGETVSDLQISPYRVVSDAVSIGGAFSRSARRVGMRVRIVNERFTDDDLAEKLYSLQSHIERGGAFSFAVDSSNIFCAFSKGGLPSYRGASSIAVESTLFSAYGGTAIASGDVLHVECPSPRGNREEVRANSYSAPTLTLSSALKYDHDGPVMFRHRDFFPALFWPERETGNPPLTHDHRIAWSWDISVEAYPAHTFQLWEGEGPGAEESADEQGGGTLDEEVGGPSGASEATEEGSTIGLAPGFSTYTGSLTSASAGTYLGIDK